MLLCYCIGIGVYWYGEVIYVIDIYIDMGCSSDSGWRFVNKVYSRKRSDYLNGIRVPVYHYVIAAWTNESGGACPRLLWLTVGSLYFSIAFSGYLHRIMYTIQACKTCLSAINYTCMFVIFTRCRVIEIYLIMFDINYCHHSMQIFCKPMMFSINSYF